MASNQRLIELVHEKALQRGEFVLASGKKANFYLDCRKLTFSSEGINEIAEGMLKCIGDDMPDAVGGMELGAVPITAAIVARAGQLGHPLQGFVVRKKAKDHGTGNLIDGPVEPAQRAIIVEDVLTTGGSCLRAIEQAREFGLCVDRAIAIIDRLEGARERFEAIDVQLDTLLTLDDLDIG